MVMKMLVIAPHSDDAELGVGGYIHRENSQRAAYVKVVVLASGAHSNSKLDHQVSSHTRMDEGLASGKVLGVSEYKFLKAAPDSAFGLAHMGELIKAIEDVVFSKAWDEVFIPLPSFHGDHVVTYDACIAALRPHLNRTFPRRLFAYEYPGQSWGPAAPTGGRVYAPLSADNLNAKLRSLKEHSSQWASDQRSLYGVRGVRALAELRGAECSVACAELFYLLKAVTL